MRDYKGASENLEKSRKNNQKPNLMSIAIIKIWKVRVKFEILYNPARVVM